MLRRLDPIPARLAACAALASLLAGCGELGAPLSLRAICEVSLATHDFGTLNVGTSDAVALTVRNRGTAELHGNIRIGCPGPTPFSVAAGGGAFALSPGESLVAVVSFAPTDPGSFTCALDVAPGCAPVALAGSAVVPIGPVCSVSPTGLDFGDVEVGASLDGTFTVKNVGTIPFTADVGTGCGPFTVYFNAGVHALDPGDSVVVTVLFEPTAGGLATCDLSTGTACGAVTLVGNGTNPAPTVLSYANDIQPIFNAFCVSCHGAFGSGALDLRSSVSYANLVNHVSFSYAPALRVVPNDPTHSVLYGKITFSGTYDGGMPQGGPMPTASQDKIRDWINAGAPNN